MSWLEAAPNSRGILQATDVDVNYGGGAKSQKILPSGDLPNLGLQVHFLAVTKYGPAADHQLPT